MEMLHSPTPYRWQWSTGSAEPRHWSVARGQLAQPVLVAHGGNNLLRRDVLNVDPDICLRSKLNGGRHGLGKRHIGVCRPVLDGLHLAVIQNSRQGLLVVQKDAVVPIGARATARPVVAKAVGEAHSPTAWHLPRP
eukprot:5328488-Prymnesium_polylepis.1